MEILKYNKYKFILDNFEFLNEGSDYNQYSSGYETPTSLVGVGYGYATDPQLTISPDGSSPYADNYSRTAQMVNDLGRVIKNIQGDIVATLRHDFFLNDLDEYGNFKILRVFINTNLKVDLYISFDFNNEEYFGVFNNFNGIIIPPKFKTDLFTDNRYAYIDREYYLKLVNYLYKLYYNWFIPDLGKYVNNKPCMLVKNDMGTNIELKEGTVVEVKGYNIDDDNQPYIIIKYKDEIYTINKNDYFYFKYWFEVI